MTADTVGRLKNLRRNLTGVLLNLPINTTETSVAALIAMLVVLNILRKLDAYERLSKVANHFLMFLGFMLLLMQLHGYQHQSLAEENWFDNETHKHIHEDMDIVEKNSYNMYM